MPPGSTPGSVTTGPRAVPVGVGKHQFFKKVTSSITVGLFMPLFCDNLSPHGEKVRNEHMGLSACAMNGKLN